MNGIKTTKFTIIAVILLILISSGLLFQYYSSIQTEKPTATLGTVDLTNWDFEEHGTVRLNGEWLFYWNALFTAEDFAGARALPEPIIAEVPNVWTEYQIHDEPLPGFGYGTYRLHVKLNEESLPPRLGIKLPDVSTSCKVMVAGKTLAECGVVAEDKENYVGRMTPQSVYFETPSSEFDIVVQISNYIYDRGGMWYVPDIGTEQQIQEARENELAVQLMLFGIFLFIGCYHLGIFLIRRSERAALYFAVGCLIGALRLLFVGDMFITNVFPELSIGAIVVFRYFTYYGGMLVLVLYLRQLYPQEIPRYVTTVTAVISSAFMLSVVATPLHISTHIIQYYHIFTVILALWLIAGIVLAVVRKRDGASLQLFGLSVFVIAVFHDVIYNMFYITAFVNETNSSLQFLQRQMMQFGLLVIVFVQAIILVRRYSKAFRTIEQMSEKLISLNRMKDEFLANTSHELQTPLHGIINMTQSMLEGSMGSVNRVQRDNLSMVVSVARRLTNLIMDILDYSRLKSGEIKLERRKVSLQGALLANIEVFRYYVGDKPIKITLDMPDDLPYVYVDENRLLQILYNLIGNAVKFTEVGEIRIQAKLNGDVVETSVSDTGIGIAEENLERIFQSFEQVGSSISREYGGVGLGLSITKYLVELSGGEMKVASTLGEGSVFTFTLPVGKDDHDEAQQSKELTSKIDIPIPSLLSGPQGQKLDDHVLHKRKEEESFTILAVDDEKANLQVIVSVLAQEPYHIITVTSGKQALEQIQQKPDIDLVILDVMMPKLSGYEVCKQIRQRFSMFELPVLLVTVKNEPEDMLNGFALGANDFLAKPFYSHELRGRVRTLLELKKSVETAIQSEMAFLQAQIKPHFLYNALNTIIGICPRDPQKASDLLTELSLYLRSSFDFRNKDKFVELSSELQLVEAYLSIEKARFDDRLRVEYNVNASLYGQLPPLTIQPIVENAVRHGILPKLEGGHVKLTVAEDEQFIRIVVEDDGVGMSEQQLERLFQVKTSSVGLRNIESRLKRLYGFGLDIWSQEGVGTRVTVKIPLVKDAQLEEELA